MRPEPRLAGTTGLAEFLATYPRVICLVLLVLIFLGLLAPGGMALSPHLAVVVDPGHGRSPLHEGYTGAINQVKGVCEDDYNLDIALRLTSALRSRGVEVYLTRRDEYLPPDYDGDGAQTGADRAYLANNLRGIFPETSRGRADIYVSIHLNASRKPAARGTTVVYSAAGAAKRWAEESKSLSESIHRELSHVLESSAPPFELNGVYFDKLEMPHAVVEVAFITNLNDLAWIDRTANRALAAELIAEGIIRWWLTRK